MIQPEPQYFRVECDGFRYLSELFCKYKIDAEAVPLIVGVVNDDELLPNPTTLSKIIRYGGNKYSGNPYLNIITFQIVEKNDEFIIIRENTDNYEPEKTINRDTTHIYRIPIIDIENSVKLIPL